jgi:hypothetical protein
VRAAAAIAGRGLLAWAAAPSGSQMPSEPHELLRTLAGFTPGQLAALDRGEPVARTLRTERREIAIVGAVRIKGPRERLIQRYRDVSNLLKSKVVMQIGTFSRPPAEADVAPLIFEHYDLDAPKHCRPGDCAVRLSADAIERMRSAVNWSAPDARQQSAAAWRGMLTRLVAGYASGDRALPEYANREEPLSLTAEFEALYPQFGYLERFAPGFLRYLRDYPRGQIDSVEDTLYWSKNDLGMRPVVVLTHQTIYAPPGRAALIAIKRLYAVHYIDMGLDVTMLTDDGSGGFYMTIVDRVRTRSLTGITRAVVRSIVLDRTRAGVERLLRSSKSAVESRIPNP